jgi:dolichyl-phosphate-mannose--protein O-mannosyl transferase
VRLFLRPHERRPDPPPLRTDDRTVVLAGTLVWAVLLAVALLARTSLQEQGRGWWVWTCVTGIVLGAVGLTYVHSRNRA